ncbi:unnamed protein product [Hydatigera taeniaeformis]|uniref:Uncharacterized protein n=1 Tax=Hydatigena taeniaeformis TaxID=6205 RepID=A0A0R3X459_HYDTA|nr:unnamed protein product [Hydatigera taeniaeformis]
MHDFRLPSPPHSVLFARWLARPPARPPAWLPSRRAVILALERHDPDKENCRGSASNIKQGCDTQTAAATTSSASVIDYLSTKDERGDVAQLRPETEFYQKFIILL